MTRPTTAPAAGLAVVLLAAVMAAAGCAGDAPQDDLYLFAGAGLRPALDDMAAAYRAETGTTVTCDYGGSGMILSRLRLHERGDLFMPGDMWYVDLAEKDGLVASKTLVCYFVPVILVPKGNPAGITGLADLARPGVRLGLGDAEKCQIGRLCPQIFEKNGLDQAAIDANTRYASVTVNELGVQIKTGHLDAAIVWDAIAALYPDTAEVIRIPRDQNVISSVAVALLNLSKRPDEARRFIDFLTSDRGQAIFEKHHYRTEPPEQAPRSAVILRSPKGDEESRRGCCGVVVAAVA